LRCHPSVTPRAVTRLLANGATLAAELDLHLHQIA
jgi:hypothetical protein